MSKNNMVVEVTIKILVNFNDWDGWRYAGSSVGDFIKRILKPYFTKFKITTSDSIGSEFVEEMEKELEDA